MLCRVTEIRGLNERTLRQTRVEIHLCKQDTPTLVAHDNKQEGNEFQPSAISSQRIGSRSLPALHQHQEEQQQEMKDLAASAVVRRPARADDQVTARSSRGFVFLLALT